MLTFIKRTFLILLILGMASPAQASTTNERMVAAAKAWLVATQNDTFEFANQERRNWHFTPRTRKGLMIGDMSEDQKLATIVLMRTTLSSGGMLKARDIMRLEAVLADIEGSSLSYRNPEGYYVSVFGNPDAYPWGWRLEGHHLSLNVTLSTADTISVTPLFTGTNPARPSADALVSRPVQYDEMILALRLIRTFKDDQETAAKLDRSPRNIISGPGRGDAFKKQIGVFGAAMNNNQLRLLRSLISAYVGITKDDIGQKYMTRVDAGLSETAFAWAGEASENAEFYYRIHGPRILIEFDNTRGGNHIHAVWRDPINDFGRDTLSEHYANDPKAHSDWP